MVLIHFLTAAGVGYIFFLILSTIPSDPDSSEHTGKLLAHWFTRQVH